MSPQPTNRLYLTVLPINLPVQLYLLWSEEPHSLVKIVASVILVGTFLFSFHPMIRGALSGAVYGLMFLIAVGVCFLEFSVATWISGPSNPDLAFDTGQVLALSVVFAVVVGLPVMLLNRLNREFVLFELGSDNPPTIRPIRPGEFAGGRSGCGTQLVAILIFGLISVVGGWIAGSEKMAGIVEVAVNGIMGPAPILMIGVVRNTMDSSLVLLIMAPLFALGVVAMFALTFFINVQFAAISRLAGWLAGRARNNEV